MSARRAAPLVRRTRARLELATEVADQLDIDAAPLRIWEQTVMSSPSDSSTSQFLRARVGWLTVELRLQHLGTTGNNYLHMIFTRHRGRA